MTKPHEYGSRPENKSKNRYANLVACEYKKFMQHVICYHVASDNHIEDHISLGLVLAH